MLYVGGWEWVGFGWWEVKSTYKWMSPLWCEGGSRQSEPSRDTLPLPYCSACVHDIFLPWGPTINSCLLLSSTWTALDKTCSVGRQPSFQVSQGLTALTFWVLVHFLFIFGAILVYGVQLTLIRFSKEEYNAPEEEKDPEKRARIIDKRMLLLFSSLYLLFNILYWPVCLFGQKLT